MADVDPIPATDLPSRPAAVPTVSRLPPSRDATPLESVLGRPDAERRREHRYRFAQAVVFGLPALGLQAWGTALGGNEAPRWVGILQALLTGWVLYVAAAGMLFEGFLLLLLRRRVTADFLVAAVATALYLASLFATGRVVAGASTPAPVFWVVVLLLLGWTGLRWGWLTRSPHVRPSHAP